MKPVTIAIAGIIGLTASCSDFPDLNAAISDRGRQAAFPSIIDTGDLIYASTEGQDETEAAVDDLLRRARLLRQRARALRQPVLDDRTRRLLAEAVQRHQP